MEQTDSKLAQNSSQAKMTVDRPFLILNRLVVRAGEHKAYDEKFHVGLNIIRGTNSSGKSTILDFIFFALGGDVNIWKTAASKCTDVSAEVNINGTIITLHRKVTQSVRVSLAIYWGSLEESEKHHFKNWAEYNYASRGETEGFSKILFRALGYPEVKSDQENNLTMHQILRLIYVDQISRTTSLMREEDFDTPLTRRTIAELMFGVYDDTLYADEMNLKIRQRELKEIALQVIHTRDILDAVDEKLNPQELKKRITGFSNALDKLNSELEKVLDEKTIVKDTSQGETEKLRETVGKLRNQAVNLSDKIEELQLDIADSAVFLNNLRARYQAIEESLITRESLGDLPVCPLCTASVKHIEGEIKCEFSGKTIPGDFGRSNMLKMREELRFQIKESESLQIDREKEVQELAIARSAVTQDLEQQSRNLRQKVKAVKSARDNRLDELYQQKGHLTAEIENAAKLGKYLDVFITLKRRESQLKGFIAEITETIKSKKQKQAGRFGQALGEIKENVVDILANDLKRQEEFSNVESVDLLFEKNTYLLNGRNNFSASSNAVLKNAIHFGILFAATEDNEFRFPRFVLCDNAEDGGMETPRSQNFQKVIADKAAAATQPFQIILSTSMIHPELDNTKVCVGPAYSREHKSLNLPQHLQEQAIAPESPIKDSEADNHAE